MQSRYRAERQRGRMLPTHRRFSIDVRLDSYLKLSTLSTQMKSLQEER